MEGILLGFCAPPGTVPFRPRAIITSRLSNGTLNRSKPAPRKNRARSWRWHEGVDDCPPHVIEIGRGEVREVAVLRVTPFDVFRRIEVRGIGREPLDPDGLDILGQPRRHEGRPVRAVPVPDEREAMRQVAPEDIVEAQDLRGSDVVNDWSVGYTPVMLTFGGNDSLCFSQVVENKALPVWPRSGCDS